VGALLTRPVMCHRYDAPEPNVFDRYSAAFPDDDPLPLTHWTPSRPLYFLAVAMERAIARGRALAVRDLEEAQRLGPLPPSAIV
jgi:hypothetical protein